MLDHPDHLRPPTPWGKRHHQCRAHQDFITSDPEIRSRADGEKVNVEEVLRYCGYCGGRLEDEQDGCMFTMVLDDGRLMGILVHRECGNRLQEEHRAEALYDGS